MKARLLWVLVLFHSLAGYSQSVQAIINSNGNSFKKDHLTLEWSIGEMCLVNTMQSTDGSRIITNGFFQPFIMTYTPGPSFDAGEVRILPNPTQGKLEVNLLTLSKGVVRIYVYDASGKIVISKQTYSYGIGLIENLDLTMFAMGTYFVKIEIVPEASSTPKTGTYKVLKI
jgi:hypothetical protein